MNVAQRGTSSTTSSGGMNTVDRFGIYINGTDNDMTQEQITLTSSDTGPWAKGFRNAIKLTNGNQTGGFAAGDYFFIEQGIEGQNIAQSGWDYTSASSYITLSFWIKSSVAQNFYGYLKSNDGTAQRYAFETGSLSANTWTKITKTIPGNSNVQIDNDNGGGLYLELMYYAGTNLTDPGVSLNTWGAFASGTRTPDNTSTWWTTNDATLAWTGVQLEVGDVATDFEHRSYGDELQRCKRYYQEVGYDSNIIVNHILNNSDRVQAPPLPVTMRATPTFTSAASLTEFSSGTNRSVSATYQVGPSGGGYIQLGASMGNGVYYRGKYAAEL